MGNKITVTHAKLQTYGLLGNKENRDKIGLFVEFLTE
jgi:hypothetical protein